MPKCDQCGYIHPALPVGVKCPMAKNQTEKDLKIFEILQNFSNLVQEKAVNIKDMNKFTTFVQEKTVQLINSYSEGEL